ncbi:MAG: UDP-N-acetylmuramoyl-L-alanyl-D-glutamate--2,6-diaminopimelate ligase, partial [Syntrophales bacterium]|nr:UDP-N-acetylmuramoyl-L-alanyl-D-glutamate--2,6-diaminopimelate ligase [Syntrophales bacterium]
TIVSVLFSSAPVIEMELFHLMEGVEILNVSGDLAGGVSALCCNSRNCHENSLFVAISGLKSDGHDYIPDAIARGARFIVYDKESFSWGQILNLSPPVTALKVANSRRALGILAKNFYRHPSSQLVLIGVTGTNGKTTVAYLLEAIFQAAGFSVGVLGTVNYRFKEKVLVAPNTTPESLEAQRILREMVSDGVTHAIAEVSSHAVDLKRVDDCAFDLGIFTNLSQEHLDYHQTMENYFQAKKRFFEKVLPSGAKGPMMIVNIDDPWGRRLLREVTLSSLTFGIENRSDVSTEEFKLSVDGIKATIRTGGECFTLSSPLLGRFNLYNILAATAAAISLHIPEKFIRNGIESFKSVPGRMEVISKPGQPQVFVDYAHTSDALQKVLENLFEIKKGKIITVFGCGGDRDRGKRPLMGKAATAFSDLVVLTSDNSRTEDPLEIIREIEGGIHPGSIRKYLCDGLDMNIPEKGYVVIPDRKTAIEKAISLAGDADIVLIAGKGHEDYQIVGEQRFLFDDRKIARDTIERRQNGLSYGQGKTAWRKVNQ